MIPSEIVGYSAVAVLVIGWLVLSLSGAGRWREFVEWLSATALYVALLSLFFHLLARARESDSTAAFWAFAFLCAFFGAGLLMSLWNTVQALRGPSKARTSATN